MNKLLLLPVIAATAGMSGVGFLGNDFFMNIAGFGTSHQDIPNPVVGDVNVRLDFSQDPFTLIMNIDGCRVSFIATEPDTLYRVKCLLTDQNGNFVINFGGDPNRDGFCEVVVLSDPAGRVEIPENLCFIPEIDIQEIDDIKLIITKVA